MRIVRRCVVGMLLMAEALSAAAQGASSPEQRTARHMESIRNQPAELLLFLRDFPKGGDLHNHLSGSVYAESYLRYAADEGLCVDGKTSTLLQPPCDEDAGKPPVSKAYRDQALYNQIVDAFSIRNFQPDDGITLSEHFFAAFLKFDAATKNHRGEMLAEVVSRSASENVSYLELIAPLDAMRGSALGAKVGWDPDLGKLRQKLLDAGLPAQVEEARRELDVVEARMRQIMRCGQPDADVGCKAVVRHIFEVHRAFPPEQVFAEMVFGFEMAKADARVVSVNPVMAEAWFVSRRDFDLHMKMFDFLHKLYPNVRLTLHAGELAPELVPPEDLRDHIWKSIEIGHAQRIGHGIDALYERDPEKLLEQMAKQKILVEFCPTSYELLLSAPGVPHPLPMFLKHGVPVALATDDIGVSRSDTTAEYMRALRKFPLTYRDLKRMARNSLEYAFLEGASVWSDAGKFRMTAECAADKPAASIVSATCKKFLDASEKARLQWRLEGDLARFEGRF